MMAPSATVADSIPFSAFAGSAQSASAMTYVLSVIIRTSTTFGIASIGLPVWATKKFFSNVVAKARRSLSEASFRVRVSFAELIGLGRIKMVAMDDAGKSPKFRIGPRQVPDLPLTSCGTPELKTSTGETETSKIRKQTGTE